MNITEFESEDASKVDEVNKLTANLTPENFQLAIRIIYDVIKRTPNKYIYKFIHDNRLYIKCWDKSEFLHFVSFNSEIDKFKEVLWIPSAYPRAHYYFGLLLSKAKEYEKAITVYHRGMDLEPTNPKFLIGLGNIFSKQGDHNKAFNYFNLVGDVNPHISNHFKAMALRSEGVQLIELNEIEMAKHSFMKSLELEPNNQNAINELLYIEEIGKGNKNNYSVSLKSQFSYEKKLCMYCLNEITDGAMRKIGSDLYFICKDCYNIRGLSD